MASSFYYELLDLPAEATLADVKAAYHRAAKSNHPDLFPERERERREMRMMKINEAYLAIVCRLREGAVNRPVPPAPQQPRRSRIDPAAKAVGPLRDPAYTYYKLGFGYFSEGRRTLSKHYLSGGQRVDFSTENIHVLRLAVASLHYFHRAYACFERVASDYPTSLWARDAHMKIFYLKRYNAIYHRICDNLSKQIASIDLLRARNPAEA